MSGDVDLSKRVDRLENQMAGVVSGMENLTTQFGRLVDGLAKVEPAAQLSANSVKEEMREEGERRSKEKSELFKNALALAGFVALIVGAFGGPYLNKVNATAESADLLDKRVGEIREVLAQQGAGIGKNGAMIDNIRDRLVRDEQKIEDNQKANNYKSGWMNAKYGYGGP